MDTVSAGTHRDLSTFVVWSILPSLGKGGRGSPRVPEGRGRNREGTWLTSSMELPRCVRHPAQSLQIFRALCHARRFLEQVLVSTLQAGLADLFPSSQAYSLRLENISTTSKWEQLINE